MLQLTMPELGEGVVEARVVQWLKGLGDEVALYEPLVEVDTDKAVVQVPAPAAGILTAIVVPAGEVAAVGQVIGSLTESAAPAMGALAATAKLESSAGPTAAPRISPMVLRLAERSGVDLAQVRGTGPGARITREDVLSHVVERAAAPPQPPAPVAAAEADVALIPHTRIRRAMADHMLRSTQTAPHAWVMVEVDMTGVRNWREQQKQTFERDGLRLTYFTVALWAAARTLPDHPLLNATWNEQGVTVKRQVHVGVAMATIQGLVVPVIPHANTRDLRELAAEVHSLAASAQAGRLPLAACQGGTFTIDNTGALGSVLSVPIIHQPQAAILTTEAVVRRVVAVGDAIAIRDQMNMCLSFDHRVLDGAEALAFLRAVKSRLESIQAETAID